MGPRIWESVHAFLEDSHSTAPRKSNTTVPSEVNPGTDAKIQSTTPGTDAHIDGVTV